MYEGLEERFREVAPGVDFCALRVVRERSEFLAVRQDVLQPVVTSEDSGAMLTVHNGGGMGYAATSDRIGLSGVPWSAGIGKDDWKMRGGQMQSTPQSPRQCIGKM